MTHLERARAWLIHALNIRATTAHHDLAAQFAQVTNEATAERDATITALKSENEKLRGALAELADLMDGVIDGTYEPDSFTTQPARAALTKETK